MVNDDGQLMMMVENDGELSWLIANTNTIMLYDDGQCWAIVAKHAQLWLMVVHYGGSF